MAPKNLPELPSGPLSVIASFLPKEDLSNFLLASKAHCSAGRDQVKVLKPNGQIVDSQLERLCGIFPQLETLDLCKCRWLIAPRLGHLPALKVLVSSDVLSRVKKS